MLLPQWIQRDTRAKESQLGISPSPKNLKILEKNRKEKATPTHVII
jgi:hypothetical protein